jgi:hypothetical protein
LLLLENSEILFFRGKVSYILYFARCLGQFVRQCDARVYVYASCKGNQ